MEATLKLKECFGDQGGKILGGESPEECWSCELFERCHKITLATSLQGIAMDLNLITQNGLRLGWLKSYSELDRLDSTVDHSSLKN
ncbi:hypothetical protein HUU40_05440 [candidate division KSB1 bacterium]|nr:hypothetical protein [candidate division KSB1 bacterium]